MYQFSSLCFLCASKKNVEVEISSLSDGLKEEIGQFSLINFTLQGVPSKICQSCHHFLIEYEDRKQVYSRAEQMYLELLRTRNKPIDIDSIRQKYDLVEKTLTEVFEISAVEPQNQFFEVIDHVMDEDVPEIEQISEILVEKTKKIYKKIEEPKKTVVFEKTSDPPKLLNPTIIPKIVNTSRMELFKCDFCSHTASTKASMERHMKQLHLKKPKETFSCHVCLKTFAKIAILKIHQKTHLDVRPGFECPQCGKILSSQTAVNNHIKWLHSEKEFECKNCGKKFATKGAMKEHEKIHSEIKTHVCPICQKSFKTASTLTQHVDTHGETYYHCPQCNLRLNSKRTLKQHMLKHSDVINYTCEVCKAQFKRVKAYKEHLISRHTDIKAYKCEWCDKSFANGANYRKHQKDYHIKELAEAEKKNVKKIVKLPKIEELLLMSQEKQKK